MWEGRQLLGTIFVRWRRKHYLDQYLHCFFSFVLFCLQYSVLIPYSSVGTFFFFFIYRREKKKCSFDNPFMLSFLLEKRKKKCCPENHKKINMDNMKALNLKIWFKSTLNQLAISYLKSRVAKQLLCQLLLLQRVQYNGTSS